jgi:hypothetical protein
MQREIREKHKLAMDPHDAAKFANLKDGKLLRPEQPANVIATLVLDAPRKLNGMFHIICPPRLPAKLTFSDGTMNSCLPLRTRRSNRCNSQRVLRAAKQMWCIEVKSGER